MSATLALAARGQVLYGSLTGNVTDQSGAVVAGAVIEALSLGTGVARTAATDARGVYAFSDLLPGAYDVSIQAPSFRTVVHKAVRVDSNAVRRVDAQLEVSAVAEAVEVTAQTAPLQTDRADVHVV
ncbi:MAG TPA: carboxypeptidase-like regulatory domain-containing protein, partial [Vicinamibacteria bacterium]